MEVGKKKILNGFIGSNNSTQFVIPIYQRNYVWEKENINQLLKDIEKMIPFFDDESENIFHFFGSIVYIDTLHKGSFSEWTIIDGQQRLTTIFLILQVLKKIYPDSEKVITKKYLVNDEDIINNADEMARYRLKPLVSDDNVYLKIAENRLNEITDNDKASHVYKAYLAIEKELSSWKNKYSLEQILGAIDKLKVVWIQLNKDENPQQVFESINSTGVNLTAADLIRNYVLMNKDDKTQTEIYNNYWEPIEFKYVETKKLKEFFRFYISIINNSTIPDREVYERFKIEYDKYNNNEKEILSDILSYSKYYYYINESSNGDPAKGIEKLENSEVIEPFLKDYRLAKSNMPNIVVMKTMDLYYNDKKISEDDLLNTIELLTSYIVRRNLAGADTKSISNMFGSLLGKILKYFNDGMNYYKSVVKALVIDTRLTNQVMPTDKTIYEEFETSNLYSRDATSFVLKKIENNDSRINYDQLNIEHVMPQTETEYWLSKVKDKNLYVEVVNRIGNLTLVDERDNSSMHNFDFVAKKKVLEKSKHIKMNEFILEQPEWNEDVINSRSKKIATKVIEMFKYPDIDPQDLIDVNQHINITNDAIQSYEYYTNTVPSELIIDDESITEFSNWIEVEKLILSKLYAFDSEKFLQAYNSIHDEYGYTSPQISYNSDGMRNAYELVDGIYLEGNTNTEQKLKLIQRMAKELSFDENIDISYRTKKEY